MNSVKNHSKESHQAIICQSFCRHCQSDSPWKITKVSSNNANLENIQVTKISCVRCDNPMDIQPEDIAVVSNAVDAASHKANSDIYLERAMNAQKRQEAFAGTARMNWFEASQIG